SSWSAAEPAAARVRGGSAPGPRTCMGSARARRASRTRRTKVRAAHASEPRGGREAMPEKKTRERARRKKAEGKSASTQAGEFVREEILHVRQGKHGARSPKQAIAIGLSKARREGVDLPPPKGGEAKKKAARQSSKRSGRAPSRTRSQASRRTLAREGREAASTEALSRQTKSAARRRPASERSAAAKKAARTK